MLVLLRNDATMDVSEPHCFIFLSTYCSMHGACAYLGLYGPSSSLRSSGRILITREKEVNNRRLMQAAVFAF